MHDTHTVGELSTALSTFLAVQRAGSISAAAQSLHLSQPAVSRRLQSLERQLAVPLFDRTPTGLRLSSAGAVLLPHAERACAAERDGLRAVADHRTRSSGSVALGVVGSLAGPWLTAVLRTVTAQHPETDLVVSTATSRQICAQVLRGQLGLGVSYARPTDPHLHVRTLFEEELAVVCHPDHRLAGHQVAGVQELAGERWLMFPDHPDHPESTSTTVRRLLQRHQVPDVLLRPIDSLTAQRALVQAGYGIAFVPTSAVAEDLEAGRLAVIDVSDDRIASPVTLVTRQQGYLSRAATTVIDLLTRPSADEPVDPATDLPRTMPPTRPRNFGPTDWGQLDGGGPKVSR